jgi:hypothetical protein
MASKKDYIVLFVEGETEKEFYDALMKFYFQNYTPKIKGYKVFNVKGISRFETKVATKLKYEVVPKHDVSNIKVICCYDTDVFELAQKPPTNWQIVKKKVNELRISNFSEVKATRMIEDWFLKDLKGLCQYLKIEEPRRVEGKDGLEKIKILFKKGKAPKIYQKGSYSHKFIPSLNFLTIRASVKLELSTIETALGVTVK